MKPELGTGANLNYHGGVFKSFRNLFRGKATVPAGPSAAHTGGLASVTPNLIAVPTPAPPPDPFNEAWGVLSGTLEARPLQWSEEEQKLVDLVAPLVMEHFSRNHPDLASFPALAVQIIDLLNEPDVDMARLLKAISPDPAISVQVLRVANSVLYSRGTEITEMRMAVMRIGLRGVGEIAAGVAGRSLFDVALRVEYEMFRDRFNAMFLDTMAVAFGASQFAFEQHAGRPDWAFLAGMFHDMGKTLALRSLASLIIAGDVPSGLPDSVVDAVLELVHQPIGGTVHDLWGLPAHLKDICLHHHDAEVPGDLDHAEIHILRLASGLHRLVADPFDGRRLAETRQSAASMHLVRRGMSLLHREMGQHRERVKVLFGN
jgi:HD-like signal output (HDOD) protein